ncbi:MAG TPA: 2-oxo-4-hydroxy-4-carboxy-5-ureidoimidazoline decarboxylase [Drouetiella sp.]
MISVKSINELSDEAAAEMFRRCCGSEAWVEKMVAAKPFASAERLFEKSAQSFDELTHADWMSAFAAHPKIGDINTLKEKYGATKNWAQNEQAGASGISDEVAQDLAARNEEYLQKFGYIFIVCATGKSADQMLAMLKERLKNAPDTELLIAGAEQQKITHLRLEKL